eukprot:scaffold279945_cov17-Tisochrysis_lutea.AAC.1
MQLQKQQPFKTEASHIRLHPTSTTELTIVLKEQQLFTLIQSQPQPRNSPAPFESSNFIHHLPLNTTKELTSA